MLFLTPNRPNAQGRPSAAHKPAIVHGESSIPNKDREISAGGVDISQGSDQGLGYAAPHTSSSWDLEETLCFTTSDLVYGIPEDFTVTAHSESIDLNQTDPEIRTECEDTFRPEMEALEGLVSCMVSSGKRFDSVRTDLTAEGFAETTAVEAWKVFEASANPATATPVGYGLVAQVGTDQTEQHWVWFSDDAFLDVRCVHWPEASYTGVQSFLNAMDSLATGTVTHAYECAQHSDTLPWLEQ